MENTNLVCSSDNINFESKVIDLTGETKKFSTAQQRSSMSENRMHDASENRHSY